MTHLLPKFKFNNHGILVPDVSEDKEYPAGKPTAEILKRNDSDGTEEGDKKNSKNLKRSRKKHKLKR
jgi:hypothetical protein